MSAAARPILLLAFALSACSEAPSDVETNNAAGAEVEALPPDESAATPTDELDNGAADPNVNEANSAY